MNLSLQAVVHLRQAFLERLGGLKASRENIAKGLTGSVPSTFRNRISAVAALGVRPLPLPGTSVLLFKPADLLEITGHKILRILQERHRKL